MSNILPTVGRPVQYVDFQGNILAAIITQVQGSSVQLNIFKLDGTQQRIDGIFEFNQASRETQVNAYKLTWQGR